MLEVPLVQFMTVPLCGGAAAGDSCCDVCRVEFKTQEDDETDSTASKDSRELVMAAQTIFQMGGAILFALLDLGGVANVFTCPVGDIFMILAVVHFWRYC